jgi:hypothetical protein
LEYVVSGVRHRKVNVNNELSRKAGNVGLSLVLVRIQLRAQEREEIGTIRQKDNVGRKSLI